MRIQFNSVVFGLVIGAWLAGAVVFFVNQMPDGNVGLLLQTPFSSSALAQVRAGVDDYTLWSAGVFMGVLAVSVFTLTIGMALYLPCVYLPFYAVAAVFPVYIGICVGVVWGGPVATALGILVGLGVGLLALFPGFLLLWMMVGDTDMQRSRETTLGLWLAAVPLLAVYVAYDAGLYVCGAAVAALVLEFGAVPAISKPSNRLYRFDRSDLGKQALDLVETGLGHRAFLVELKPEQISQGGPPLNAYRLQTQHLQADDLIGCYRRKQGAWYHYSAERFLKQCEKIGARWRAFATLHESPDKAYVVWVSVYVVSPTRRGRSLSGGTYVLARQDDRWTEVPEQSSVWRS